MKLNGHTFKTIKQEKSLFIKQIKEKLARTSVYSIEKELSEPDDSDIEERAFVLPDGKVIELERELRFRMGEILVWYNKLDLALEKSSVLNSEISLVTLSTPLRG